MARDSHRRCIYYPSPKRSVCEDTLVVPLVIPRLRVAYARIRELVRELVRVCVCVLALNRLIANFN